MSFDDAGLKLLSVFRIWNYVQYFNPYRQLADRPWEEALMYAVQAVVQASDRDSYGNVLRAMAVYTDDSHSFAAYMPGGFLRQLIRLAAIPENMRYAAPFISTLYADGKYIVTWTCRSDTCDLHRGDAVIAVNGKPVESLIEKNSHVIPSSNPGSIQRETALSISFSAGDSASYTVIRGKDILTLKPKMMPFKKFRRALYSSGIRQSTLTWFRGNELSPFDVIGDSVAYIHAEDISAHDFRKCDSRPAQLSYEYDTDVADVPHALHQSCSTCCHTGFSKARLIHPKDIRLYRTRTQFQSGQKNRASGRQQDPKRVRIPRNADAVLTASDSGRQHDSRSGRQCRTAFPAGRLCLPDRRRRNRISGRKPMPAQWSTD